MQLRFKVTTRFVLIGLAGLFSMTALAAKSPRSSKPAQPAVPEEIVLRHALDGKALDTLATLVLHFNDEQKGKAKVTLQGLKGMDAADLDRLPHMAILDTDDSIDFFRTRPNFKPLYQVMSESGEKFASTRFYPLVIDAVNNPAGRALALPLGLSLPVLMWNKDAFRKAGLDPEVAPKTWWEMQDTAGHLFKAGYKCPLTSSQFGWVHLENLSSQHGEPVALRERNGATKVVLNRLVDVKHIALLASWHKSFYFHYFGPGHEAEQKFLSGECAMLTGESSLYLRAVNNGFGVGIAKLPYHDDVHGVNPGRLLPDGASLWILAGHKKNEYKVAARFANFLLRPDVQQSWVKATGFLPMTPSAIEALKASGIDPVVIDTVVRRLSQTERKSQECRVPHNDGHNRVRSILNEEIATVWANTKPAKEALDTAMTRANGPDTAQGQGKPTKKKKTQLVSAK